MCLTMEKLRDESLKKGREEGRAEGREEGRVEGREEGENLMARLMALLLEKGLVEDAQRASSDSLFRKELYKKSSLI